MWQSIICLNQAKQPISAGPMVLICLANFQVKFQEIGFKRKLCHCLFIVDGKWSVLKQGFPPCAWHIDGQSRALLLTELCQQRLHLTARILSFWRCAHVYYRPSLYLLLCWPVHASGDKTAHTLVICRLFIRLLVFSRLSLGSWRLRASEE